MMRLYLDNNASMPLWDEASEAVMRGLDLVGNPSASHRFGAECAQVLEGMRADLLNLLGISDGTLLFTSGATESNFLTLHGLKPHVKTFVMGATEHPSLLKAAASKVFESTLHICPVDETGRIATEALTALLEKMTPPFCVSIGAVNHETGVVQDIPALSEMVHNKGGWLHTDAAQVVGKVPFHCGGADVITLSSHKAGGPAGVGGLVLKDHVPFTPPMAGGEQEMGLRPGTPAVALTCGFVAAVRCCLSFEHQDHLKRCQRWRDHMESALTYHGAVILGQGAHRAPQTSCITMPKVSREIQMVAFDRAGIAISAGSACQSGATEPSPTLLAMGIAPEVASTAIRLSTGPLTREAHIHRFIDTWTTIYKTQTQGASHASAA